MGSIPCAWSVTRRWRSCCGGQRGQCRAGLAGPHELDLGGHGGVAGGGRRRRRGATVEFWGSLSAKELLGEGCSDWGRSIWVRGARRRASGAASDAAQGGGVVAARGAAWDACAREEVPRGGPGGAGGLPGSIWPRPRGGRSPPAAYGRRRPKQSKPGERDGDRGSFAISENSRDLSVI